jgi:DNA-binding PucR family transcriptional regulator
VELEGEVSTLEAVAHARRRMAGALEQLDRDAGLAAAISTRCGELEDYVRAYGEAQQVMSCLHTLSAPNGSRVLSADELGPGRLFLASSDRPAADRFAQDALGALLASEETLELLRTLYVFFECARSVRRSAPALGVHENTIRYRLTRIEEMTGLCVGSDSTDQLTAQLALLVLRLEGRLPDISELVPAGD